MSATDPHADSNELPVKERRPYEKPRVLVSYDKEELEAAMRPQGIDPQGGGGGCGCSCAGGARPKKSG